VVASCTKASGGAEDEGSWAGAGGATTAKASTASGAPRRARSQQQPRRDAGVTRVYPVTVPTCSASTRVLRIQVPLATRARGTVSRNLRVSGKRCLRKSLQVGASRPVSRARVPGRRHSRMTQIRISAGRSPAGAAADPLWQEPPLGRAPRLAFVRRAGVDGHRPEFDKRESSRVSLRCRPRRARDDGSTWPLSGVGHSICRLRARSSGPCGAHHCVARGPQAAVERDHISPAISCLPDAPSVRPRASPEPLQRALHFAHADASIQTASQRARAFGVDLGGSGLRPRPPNWPLKNARLHSRHGLLLGCVHVGNDRRQLRVLGRDPRRPAPPALFERLIYPATWSQHPEPSGGRRAWPARVTQPLPPRPTRPTNIIPTVTN